MEQSYTRPGLSTDELKDLAKFARQLLARPKMQQVGILAGLLSENAILTKEVNLHRKTLGFEPLKTYDPKLKK